MFDKQDRKETFITTILVPEKFHFRCIPHSILESSNESPSSSPEKSICKATISKLVILHLGS